MRAAEFSRFGGPEVLEIVDRPDPLPGTGEVRIAVRAAGVNASDTTTHQRSRGEDSTNIERLRDRPFYLQLCQIHNGPSCSYHNM